MKKIFVSISFWIGFISSLFLFVAVNAADIIRQTSRICFDCDKGYGKPFRIYESGSMIHNREILWGGLIADVMITIVVSIGIGLISYFIATKLFKRSPLK